MAETTEGFARRELHSTMMTSSVFWHEALLLSDDRYPVREDGPILQHPARVALAYLGSGVLREGLDSVDAPL